MPTRNVVLTDHHEKVIDRLVKSGRYQNASEVMREALRLIEQRDAEDAAKLKTLKEAAAAGFADLDEGRYSELAEDEVGGYVAEIGKRARKKAKKR